MHNNGTNFHQIGIIHSHYDVISKVPIQPVFCGGIKGTVVSGGIYAAL